MKIKRIIIASAVVVLSAIFPVSANATVDTNTYVTAVPNVPATSLSAGTCPTGQTLSGLNCVVAGSSPAITENYCPSVMWFEYNGVTQSYAFSSTGTAFGNPVGCRYYQYVASEYPRRYNGLLWQPFSTQEACSDGSTPVNGTCSSSVFSRVAPTQTEYSCPNGYVLTGVNCMSATYATINATPIWDTVRDWFLGSLIPKVVALTFIAIGIFLTINTVRRNGKKLI